MKFPLSSFFFLSLSFSSLLASQKVDSIQFAKKGTTELTLSKDQIKNDLLKLKTTNHQATLQEFFNPFRNTKFKLFCFELFPLLDDIYGSNWRESKALHFVSLDGYNQISPIKIMLQKSEELKSTGYLCYRGEKDLHLPTIYKNEKLVNTDPFWVMWSNFNVDKKASHGDVLKWPYQLWKINLE